MRNTRVKVKREFLIEKMKEALAKEQKKYDEQLAAYEVAIVALAEIASKELVDLSKKISKDPKELKSYVRGYRHDKVIVHLNAALTDEEPTDYGIKRLQKQIRVLEAAADDTISVSSMDDYYSFL